ncbi:MAG: serine--tRNA ligase [Alphaproteobacteria bacterium]|nr:serine--tRNA ligase [Alphaproteobacteria bacterium]
MIDPNVVAQEPERVRDSLRRRNADEATLSEVDRLVALSERRRALVTERDNLNADRNRLSQQIGGLYKAGQREEADALKVTVQAGNARIAVIEEELATVDGERDAALMGLPNLLDARVPDGRSEADNVEVRRWGSPTGDGQTGESHVEIGTRLGILDLERATKLTGTRFWVLSGAGARLERALINFFLDLHVSQHGYTEVMVPYMVHRSVAEGTGQLPKFEKDMFRLAEPLNGQDVFLIPTAEVPVTNLHREEILEADQLPLKYAAFTPCFRSEAGSAGRDVRGLIRVHQFHKVELVWITTPEDADACHQALVGHAEKALQLLELPYRVMELCAADTSFGAARCYDLEVWLPSQGYREISSCSHFGDFQARRMQLRYRPAGEKKAKPRAAHTLNGSGLAVGRTLVAILENHLQPDGSVRIPAALRPYMGGVEAIGA